MRVPSAVLSAAPSIVRSTVTSIVGLAALAAVSAPALALTVSIDSFTVTRGTSLFFFDDFLDGNPPPSAPNLASGGAVSYGVFGTVGAESGGKLVLDSSLGAPTFDALGNPSRNVNVRLLTNADPTSTAGLKPGVAFSVVGLFDLPSVYTPPSSFQVRLHERDQTGNLRVIQGRVNSSGPALQFRVQDYVAGTIVPIGSAPLDLTGNPDQIALSLLYSPSSQLVTFAYAYLLGGQTLGSGVLGSTPLFVRAQAVTAGFTVAESDPAVVPVPAAALLLGPGLLGLLAFARRKRLVA